MTLTVGALLALSFLISVLGLFMFIWAQTNGLMQAGPDAAQVIFAKGEVGMVEVKGPNIFSGYWRLPQKTREEFTHCHAGCPSSSAENSDPSLFRSQRAGRHRPGVRLPAREAPDARP